MTILLHQYKIQMMIIPHTKINLLKYLDHISVHERTRARACVHVCDIVKSMNTIIPTEIRAQVNNVCCNESNWHNSNSTIIQITEI